MSEKNEVPAGELSDERIKMILLAAGYTIKPGLKDLKAYVYAGARALLAAAPRPPVARPVAGDATMPTAIALKTAVGDVELVRLDDAEAAPARQANACAALIKSLEARNMSLADARASWQEAIKTLQSERDANAVLTGELTAMTAERDALLDKMMEMWVDARAKAKKP